MVNIAEPVVVNSSYDIPYINESIKRNRNTVPNNMTALLTYLFLKCFSSIKDITYSINTPFASLCSPITSSK